MSFGLCNNFSQMGGKRKKKAVDLKEKGVTPLTINGSITARNLRKSDLGAVIFGCKHHTINECHTKLLFGLPAPHLAYVEKVRPGLPLFLFNYSDRKLHGIYEAISSGQRNMDPHAWTDNTEYYTPYPAQVRIKVRRRCSPLSEDEFSPIIAENYYETRLFWFELDQAQTDGLISLFTSRTCPRNIPMPQNTVFPDSDGGQASSKALACLDNVNVAWGGSYAAIVSGKNGSIPEKKSISLTERKWSSLFESLNPSVTTRVTKDDRASSSKVPLISGEKKLFRATDNSKWPIVKPDLEKNQSIETDNSMWATENYHTESQLEVFDISCELDGYDSDANSDCSYYTAIEGMSSGEIKALLIKLMEEVEALKVSHQVLQGELVDSKATIQLLKSQYRTLESRVPPSIEDVEEANDQYFV